MTSPTPLQYCTIPRHSVVNTLPEPAQILLSWLYWHRNKITKQLNPRHSTLARELHWSYWKVKRYIAMLRDSGIIRAIKGQRGNSYEIRPSEEWRKPQPKATVDDALCAGIPDRSPAPRQEAFILYEPEAILLNKKSDAAAVGTGIVQESGQRGGGGSPAALPEKAKTQHNAAAFVPDLCPGSADPANNSPEISRCRRDDSVPGHQPATTVDAKSTEVEAIALVQELLPHHPAAGNAARAVTEIIGLLSTGVSTDLIRFNHTQFRRMWEVYRPGRFIPQLWRWISDNDWRFPPDANQIRSNADPNVVAQREDAVERERIAAYRVKQAERDRELEARQAIRREKELEDARRAWARMVERGERRA